jgi:CHAT domain-containing protein/Flp pilus assembly protein TadD
MMPMFKKGSIKLALSLILILPILSINISTVQAQNLRVSQNQKSVEAEEFYQEGLALYQQGTAESLRQAIEKWKKALILFRAIGSRDLEAATLLGSGTAYDNLGKKQKALDFYEQALSIYKKSEDRGREAMTLNNIGKTYDDLGDKQKALEFYNQALPLRRAVGDYGGEAITLSNIGKVYSNLGEKQKALDFYNLALPLFQMVRDPGSQATTLNNIGGVYSDLGDKQRALSFYNQVLPIFRKLGAQYGEAITLNNIGSVYSSLGEKQKALEFYNQALPIHRAVGNRGGEATTLNNIGGVYDDSGEKQKALEFYNQALPIHRAVGDQGREAGTLNNIGAVYSSLGEKQKALEFYNQVLPLVRAVRNRGGEATTLNNIGLVYDDLGEKQKALEFYNQALLLRRAVRDQGGEVTTLSNIGVVYKQEGRLPEAANVIQNAITIVEDLRTKLSDPDLKASYFSTVQDIYQLYIDLLMQMHQQQPNAGYNIQALEVSERSRARSFIDLLTEARANIRQGIDPQLVAQERQVQQQLTAKTEQRIKTPNGPQALALEQELSTLNQQLQQLQTEIRRVSPRYAALKYPQPLILKQIQQQVLDENTLLLQYSLGTDRSFLWAVTPTGITSYSLPKQTEIVTAAKKLRDLLLNPNAAPTEVSAASTTLSQMLLAPVANQLGNKRLLIVGDGALQYLPFAALTDPNKPDQPLLVNHEIVTAPSASTIAIQRQQLGQRKPVDKTVAVLADPIFSVQQLRNPNFRPPIAIASAEQQREITAKLIKNVRDISVAIKKINRGDEVIDPLPGTRQEASAITALVPESVRRVALQLNANRETAINPTLGQYRIVHFATHGLFDTENPQFSGLLLSLVNAQGKPVDGVLQLQDIYNLNLPVELVVLSACQTGLGKEIKGEGITGLTRGFMYAGAKAVVVSLWKVEDNATAALMGKFYERMLKDNLRPAAALRAAQLEMWRQKQWQAPYYWAAFELQGEWR